MILSNHRIINLTLTLANTEYSAALTDGTKFISLQCRDRTVDVKFTFVSGGSGTTYKTLFGGSEWSTRGLIQGDKTVYAQSETAGVVLEIEEWS